MTPNIPEQNETKDDIEELPSPSQTQIGELKDTSTYDAVFGEITEDGPNYRNVSFTGTVALMTKTQLGLGILSIPSAFDTLGIVPGCLCLCAIAIMCTWSDYIVGVFKLRHREVYGIDDAGALMFGAVGREVFGTIFCLLYWIFVAGSGMLSLSIGLNAVSAHGACTAIFLAVAGIVGFLFSSIKTLGRITWIAWVGLACILTAVFIVTIAVGIQDRPAGAPQNTPGPWTSDYKITANPSFADGIAAVSSLVFAFTGTPAFFAIAAEMREPRLYTRAVFICQGLVTAVYLTVGCVVYYYCGSYVASPALGSAGTTIKKVSYGFALPGLIATTTIVTHLPAKYIFIRLLRNTKHLTTTTPTHHITWLICTFTIALIAYIIASAIPVFDSLVSLIGALLGTFMMFQPMGCMWLYDNWGAGVRTSRTTRSRSSSVRWVGMVCWSGFMVVCGFFLMVAGTYGSVIKIMESYRASGGSKPWGCEDNSNSV